ncbi:tRNA uracil 4-sulfurtransferase ThiI [Aureibacillus halotolerans]|uniref:Probable tRNA sulfurtransferase n=1 Tax=Aureibacillus halotolerans TaxID=1508390 RepID=A0A4R6TZM8_9BACI|nr:tRNA uracil 4-sulfurtransferase ThiI [Aureibacillus halotolerans]TDQ39101.1 thiamine biosynthesis protein ThiI [Aureibacillus halotolerans]
MNIYDHILIRYGELALKGKNRHHFIQKLKDQIVSKLAPLSGHPTLDIARDRMFVRLNEANHKEVLTVLQSVFGISSMSAAAKAPSEVEKICETALSVFNEQTAGQPTRFKVTVRRPDKTFQPDSQVMNGIVGSYLLQHCANASVDVHTPDIELKVEIRHNATYVFSGDIKGVGGLPVGISGRAMLMLSGGIDSPVAGYLGMRRGLTLEAVHFHSPPYTSERAKQKVISLAQRLSAFGPVRLHIVPFTAIQETIRKEVPGFIAMTVTRRMMLRITRQLAEANDALAIVTGESLGQVASQTLESMHTIDAVCDLPILRPLITTDKIDITKVARQIQTYDISIQPHEDCCTVFLPSAPKTRPKRGPTAFYEAGLQTETLIAEALAGVETMESFDEKSEKEYSDLL